MLSSACKGESLPAIYLECTPSELATLDLRALYTEVDEDAWVQREVGAGVGRRVEHRITPALDAPGWFGLTRLAGPRLRSNATKAEFEALWTAG